MQTYPQNKNNSLRRCMILKRTVNTCAYIMNEKVTETNYEENFTPWFPVTPAD